MKGTAPEGGCGLPQATEIPALAGRTANGQRRLGLHDERCYRGGIYTGVTADLPARIEQHRKGTGSAFVRKYGFSRIVYMECHDSIEDAIAREKAIKKWWRQWKTELIESMNADWDDLYERLNG